MQSAAGAAKSMGFAVRVGVSVRGRVRVRCDEQVWVRVSVRAGL